MLVTASWRQCPPETFADPRLGYAHLEQPA